MDTTFEIHGTMIGGLWWPMGTPASKEIAFTFAREGQPWVNEADSIRSAVEQLMHKEDGDFSGAAQIDGVLTIVRRTPTRETRRYFDLRSFTSIADYIAREEDVLNALPDWDEDGEA